MPRKKPLSELTTDEALRKLFPAPVVHEAKETAKEADRKADRMAPLPPDPPKPRRSEPSRIIKPKGR